MTGEKCKHRSSLFRKITRKVVVVTCMETNRCEKRTKTLVVAMIQEKSLDESHQVGQIKTIAVIRIGGKPTLENQIAW